MATIQLGLTDFEKTVTKPGITIVDFWASWCGPCLKFAPIFEEASDNHTDITFAKVDTEQERLLSSSLNVSSIPTIMIYRDGILFYNEAGALSAESLDKILRLVAEIDMNHVHMQMAYEEKEAVQ